MVSEELFPIDDDGRSLVRGDAVARVDEHLAREGVSVCPENALFIDAAD